MGARVLVPDLAEPGPDREAIRGYLETDYDYPAELKAVADDLEGGQGGGLRVSSPARLATSCNGRWT